MKYIKRCLIFVLAIALILGAAACRRKRDSESSSEESEPSPPSSSSSAPDSSVEEEPEPLPQKASPDEVVDEMMTALKNWDLETMDRYMPDGSSIDAMIPSPLHGLLSDVLERMTYEITDTAIEGDKAYVEMEITSVEMEGAIGGMGTSLVGYLAKKKLTGQEVDNQELMQVLLDSIKVESLPEKMYPVTVHMVKDYDDNWVVDMSDPDNGPILNALSGGMVNLAQELKETLDRYGITLW